MFMKTKLEVIKNAIRVRNELTLILSDKELMTSKRERSLRGITLFTKECSFAAYRKIFIEANSALKGQQKFDKRELTKRLVFWNLFILYAGRSGFRSPEDIIKEAVHLSEKFNY